MSNRWKIGRSFHRYADNPEHWSGYVSLRAPWFYTSVYVSRAPSGIFVHFSLTRNK